MKIYRPKGRVGQKTVDDSIELIIDKKREGILDVKSAYRCSVTTRVRSVTRGNTLDLSKIEDHGEEVGWYGRIPGVVASWGIPLA